jgi:thiamine pyrophosphokinase
VKVANVGGLLQVDDASLTPSVAIGDFDNSEML